VSAARRIAASRARAKEHFLAAGRCRALRAPEQPLSENQRQRERARAVLRRTWRNRATRWQSSSAQSRNPAAGCRISHALILDLHSTSETGAVPAPGAVAPGSKPFEPDAARRHWALRSDVGRAFALRLLVALCSVAATPKTALLIDRSWALEHLSPTLECGSSAEPAHRPTGDVGAAGSRLACRGVLRQCSMACF